MLRKVKLLPIRENMPNQSIFINQKFGTFEQTDFHILD